MSPVRQRLVKGRGTRLRRRAAGTVLATGLLSGCLAALPAAGAVAAHQPGATAIGYQATRHHATGSVRPGVLNSPVLQNNVWRLTDPMVSPHGQFGMTALKNGQILAVSGDPGGGAPATPDSEVYNPATGAWTQEGNVTQARQDFGIATLNNGEVLIAGGTDASASTDYGSAELYDPATGQWHNTGSLITARRYPVMVKLANGKVLVATGAHGPPDGNRFLFSSELYSPRTGRWTATGNVNIARDGGIRAVLLHNGDVLMLGGEGPWLTLSPQTELYNPATGQWTYTGSLEHGVSAPTLTVLADGRVLMAGGASLSGTAYADAEIYDPATGVWTPTGSMNYPRSSASAVLLPDGDVLVAGGDNAGTPVLPSEIFDPTTGQWTVAAPLQDGHSEGQMAALPNGTVLIAGGYDTNGTTNVAELYEAPQPSWWSGTCDVNNHPGSYPLGTSYDGVQACGPGPFQGGQDQLVQFFPGAWSEYEWECVELVMRYMYLAYGVAPYNANGNTVVSNYPGTALTAVSNNGTSLPTPGDVISEAGTAGDPKGHTGVVTAVKVSNGTGTVTIMEQNAGAPGSARIAVSGDVLASNVTGWLTASG